MEPRRTLLDLGVRQQVTPQALRRILADPRVAAPPVDSGFGMRHGVGLAGGVLLTLGIVFWVAGNWAVMPHLAQVLLLQALVAVPGVSAVLLPRASAPLALASMGAMLGLLTHYSQSWQGGLHGWRILVWWAVICLGLALAVRRDVVWAVWGLGATSGIGWWLMGHLVGFGPKDPGKYTASYLLTWACLVLVVAVVGPWARRLTGAGGYAYRATGTAATVVLTAGALVAPGAFVAGLVVIAASARLLSLRRWFDVTLLSATLLGLICLVDYGLGVTWSNSNMAKTNDAGGFALIGLFSLGLLAGMVAFVVWRQHTLTADQRRESPGLSPVAPGEGRRGGGTPNGSGLGPDDEWYAATVRRAVDAGDLPETALAESAQAQTGSDSPVSWPVMVLQGVGGLISASMIALWIIAPLYGILEILGEGNEFWPFLFTLPFAPLCVIVLRRPRLPMFLQSGVLSLLVAGVAATHRNAYTVVFVFDVDGSAAWWDYLPFPISLLPYVISLLPYVISLGLLLLAAALIERTWIRWLLAAGAGGLSVFLVSELIGACRIRLDQTAGDRIAVQSAVLLGVAILLGHHFSVASTWPVRFSSALDAIGAGWLVGTATIVCFTADARIWWSGEGSRVSDLASALAATSVLFVLAAAVTAWIAWPPLRSPTLVAASAAFVTVAWFIPQAGPIAAAAAIAVFTRRFALGVALGTATLTVVGLSYWDSEQSLGAKGLFLIGSGAVLGAGVLLTGLFRRHRDPTPEPLPQPDTTAATATTTGGDRGSVPVRSRPPARLRRAALAAVTMVAALAVSGVDLYRSEQVAAGSEVYYLKLAQSDPREPLLGDYVALSYELPDTVRGHLMDWRSGTAPMVTARIGTGGDLDIVSLLDPGAPTPVGSVRIRCVRGRSGWRPGPDSWFIKEGTGTQYENAVLARVRLDPDGTVHLLGLADDHHTALPAP